MPRPIEIARDWSAVEKEATPKMIKALKKWSSRQAPVKQHYLVNGRWATRRLNLAIARRKLNRQELTLETPYAVVELSSGKELRRVNLCLDKYHVMAAKLAPLGLILKKMGY